MKFFFTGTIEHKTEKYRDKRLQKTFNRDLNLKRLRTTVVNDHLGLKLRIT